MTYIPARSDLGCIRNTSLVVCAFFVCFGFSAFSVVYDAFALKIFLFFFFNSLGVWEFS